jgi:hypothetical protein
VHTVGFKLRREVRDMLWAGALTPSERLLLLEIADNASDDTRQAFPGMDWIIAKCDMPSAKRVGEHLASIAAKWFEIRVEVGKDKFGKPLFAMPKKRTTYRFPTRDELVARHGAEKVPEFQGVDACKVPENQGPKVPKFQGAEGSKVPKFQGPFSSGTSSPQKISSPPPPTPSADSSALVVVDAEILEEEGVGSTSSFNFNTEALIDQIREIRPNWSATDLRTHLAGARAMLGENDEAVTAVALATAKDPDSAKPSRITAGGNPHLRNAKTALMVLAADQAPPAPNAHPDAHPFEQDPSSPTCLRCSLPKANGRHRVGNQGGGYIAQRSAATYNGTGKHVPFRNPPDIGAYHGEL